MIPETLDGWTLEKIREIAAAGATENDRFDLKADLQPAEHQRKTVAAFANSGGGFLVLGVTNDRSIDGVANAELVRDFGSKLRDGLAPSVEFRFADRPHVLPSGRYVFVGHIPRSARGPHAVYLNGSWAFVKRTAAGSNDPMTYEEVRAAFLDSGRRETDLAWLRAEVGRVRAVADRLNRAAWKGQVAPELLATRFDVSQLKALLLPVFGAIGGSSLLVESLQDLVERCARVDSVLGPIATLAMMPRDRSYSGAGFDAVAFLKEEASQTVIRADHVIAELRRLLG